MDYMIHYDHFEKYIPVSGDVSYDISTKDHFRILLPFYSLYSVQFSSITQSCPTLCDPNELQHARPRCPPTPGVYPNSCPLSR